MRKIFLFMMVSLDGYHEGLNHDLAWHNVDQEFSKFAVNQLDEADTIIFGRRTYEMMADFWTSDLAKSGDSETYKRMNSMNKLVFSKTLKVTSWENTKLAKDSITEVINKLKASPGKDIIVLGSSNLCVSLLEAGLLDEVRLMVNPIALGAGTTLFDGIKSPLKFELTKSRTFKSGNELLLYKPL